MAENEDVKAIRNKALKTALPSSKEVEDALGFATEAIGMTDRRRADMAEKGRRAVTRPRKFGALADMNVEAEVDEADPITIEGVAPTKVEVTGTDPAKAMAQSAPAAKTFGTQYKATEGGKVRFSPKGDLYVYEYDPSTKTYTIVDHPQGKGVGATFGADHPSIAKFDESRKVAQQESGVAPPEELMIEGDASVGPDSLSPTEFRERYGFSREEAEPSLDESVFAPPGARSKMAPVGPVSTAEAEDPEMRTMRAQEAGRTEEDVDAAQRASLQAIAYSGTLTDEQKAEKLNAEGVFYSPSTSPEIFDATFKGPQPIVRDGVLYNNNVLNAIATGKLSPEDWPLIKRQLERFGDVKSEVGADPTKDPRLMAKIAARRAMSDQ